MRKPLLTRGLPARGAALLFDETLAMPGAERMPTYLTLRACNTTSAEAQCALLVEGAGVSVRAPFVLGPLASLGAPRPVVQRFPAMNGDVVRWEAPEGVVVMGYIETSPEESTRSPEPLRNDESLGAPYGVGDSIVGADEKELHRFQAAEELTLGVDVPAGETLELIFRSSDGQEMRVQLPGPLVAYELYERVPMGASGTLLGRVTTGGAAIVYGCLARS